MDASEYNHDISAPPFLKYISDVFEALIKSGLGQSVTHRSVAVVAVSHSGLPERAG